MINVGELITDPDFCTTFVLEKKEGNYNEGNWEGGGFSKIVTGITEPASWKDLQSLPEGDRLQDLRAFYTGLKDPLRVTADGTLSDVIIYKGKRYRLIQAQDYSEQGYYKAIGTAEEGV